MSAWEPGDLALCVSNEKHRCPSNPIYHHLSNPHLRVGAAYEVAVVGKGSDRFPQFGCKCETLYFGDFGGVSPRFIKVTPPAADAFDHEVIDLMLGKPVREPAQ